MNIGVRLKKVLERRRGRRRLREYYVSRSENPPGSRICLNFVVFVAATLAVLALSPNFRIAFLMLAAVYSMLLFLAVLRERNKYAALEEECRAKTAEQEYKKRLEQAEPREVLAMLKEGLTEKFPYVRLELKGDCLEGKSRGEKTVVFYFALAEDEILETRRVLTILKEFGSQGFKQIRIFCGGSFSEKTKGLGERYELDLRLYNGKQLAAVLRGTPLHPTENEMDSYIKRESMKRRRKLALIKKQALQENKPGTYLIYSLALFLTAWLRIGPVYWYVFFGLLLLLLAFLTLLHRLRRKEEQLIF